MLEKIKEIICNQLGLEKDDISEKTEFLLDLKCDSLEIIDIVAEIESEFELEEIPEDALANMKSVGDLAKYVEEHA